ncbi:MAG: sugar ABC transporter permease [Boseongicola sp. SB0677_bin_26]|nr:sugar ABC transporter permease [Boseongicola sp. SB0665_bin_10]MYG28361.1 sugar ABC transporter permease [Boseongicola sp. SB0677_bin_26]
MAYKKARSWNAFLLVSLLPAVLILGGFVLLFFWGFYQSLTDMRFGRTRVDFEGLGNYARLFGRGRFWDSVSATAIYAFSAVACEAILGLAIAKLFNTRALLAKWFRPTILLPLVLPPLSVALMWTTMMNPETGVLNYFLSFIGISNFSWTSKAETAMFAVVFIDVWTFTPFFALIIFAGLRGIAPEIIEGARMNGAKAWGIFWRIELPMVLPYILLASLFRLIDSLNQFDIIFGTTQGGPGNATDVLSVSAYFTAFQNLHFGRGAAIMIVNWLIVLISAIVVVKLWQFTRRRVS